MTRKLAIKTLMIGTLMSGAAMVSADTCGKHLDMGVPNSPSQLICKEGFAVGYYNDVKSPRWAAYHATVKSVTDIAVKPDNHFAEDKAVPSSQRALMSEYHSSGYDRGQLVPATSLGYSFKAMRESYQLTNIVPMKKEFHRYGHYSYGVWPVLLDYIHSKVVSAGELYVYTGTVFDSDKEAKHIGGNDLNEPKIRVPDSFYAILYNPKKKTTISFLIPHMEHTAPRFSDYITSINCIESKTDHKFFSELPRKIRRDLKNGVANHLDLWASLDLKSKPVDCSYKQDPTIY